MCLICALYKAKMLTKKEAINAGMELIKSAESEEERAHIFDDIIGANANEYKEDEDDRRADERNTR